MDLTDRPKLADFASRIGKVFRVTTPEGESVGEWKLVSVEPLPKPPLEELAERDCFTLSLSCESGNPQGQYELTGEDGFTTRLFAVPGAADCMWVTIN